MSRSSAQAARSASRCCSANGSARQPSPAIAPPRSIIRSGSLARCPARHGRERSRLSILPPSSKLSSARKRILAAYLVTHAARDFLLEEGGVGAQRLEHRFLIGAEQRLHEHRGEAQVGRHAHFGDADEVAGERLVMDVAAHQDVGQGMAHLLADAKQADRAAFGGFDFAHHAPLPSARAGAGVNPRRRSGRFAQVDRLSPSLA